MSNSMDKTPNELASLLDRAEISLQALGKEIERAGEERTTICDSESLSKLLSTLAVIALETANVIDRITRRLPTNTDGLPELLQAKLPPIPVALPGPLQAAWYTSTAIALADVVECSKFILSNLDWCEDFRDLFSMEAQLKSVFHAARDAEGSVATADFLNTNPPGAPATGRSRT